ncbi:MAG TPA: TetR/AcrR family transcriptional regulator [Chloroflexota bacterium]|nr:TetR/AcrR family transcriptional regulator [Chloroflexota bacterium]
MTTAMREVGRSTRELGGENISRVACRIFRERGYHATSMRAIASALGWQPAALYYYYASKEELLFRIMENAVDTLAAYVREHVDPESSATERLRQAISAHVTLIADHLDELSVFLHEMKSLSPRRREVIQAKIARYEHIFRDILRDGVVSGELARVDTRLARYLILSACNWLYNWYRPDGVYEPDTIAVAFGDMILNGLAATERR